MREQLWAWVEPALPAFFVFVMVVLLAVAAYDVAGVLRARWRRRRLREQQGEG